jgi:C4-dicarboxylate transporter
VVGTLRIGVISILLYLLTIAIAIMMASEGIFILGIFNLVVFSIIFSIAFFLNKYTLDKNPEIHDSFNNPDHTIHIIAPICYLILAFIPRIVWLLWPEFGDMVLLSESTFGVVAITILAFALGGIFSYLKLEASQEEIHSEE